MTRPPDLLAVLRRSATGGEILHVEHLPARPARYADWPDWATGALVDALRAKGIDRPYAHQASAAEHAHAGRHVVLASGTASGKSLAYQLPALSALLAEPRATVLYLAPTKALAADQFSAVAGLGLPGIRAAVYDGDTPMDERDWVRAHARWVLSNPDMLHRGVLPSHQRWARLLRRLAFVIVDECHAYRGVFGSHVALVLRRLDRLARSYGSQPVFVLASATMADPAAAAGRLIGSPVMAVTEDTAPHPGAEFVLWEPPPIPTPEDENHSPVRRSAPAEAARLTAELVAAGARTLTFVRSRHAAEQTAIGARRRLAEIAPHLVDKVAAYRGGYLAEERRALEKALDSGELRAVASTNALELGVDITGLDTTVLAGYPGTLASLWQQAGRAGRGASAAVVTFIARDDPLDGYLAHHPETIFARPVEAAVTDPTNPYILGPHLTCAAAELRLTPADLELFGGPPATAVADRLVADKVLRRRPSGFFFAGVTHPAQDIDLRGSGAAQVAIVEADSGRMLGTVDAGRAPAQVHPGAVHLHRGDSYLVLDLDLAGGLALVARETPDWTTSARSVSTVELRDGQAETSFAGGVRVGVGPARVTEQVVGYLRRRPSGELIDVTPLDMPEQVLDTRAVWYAIEPEALTALGIPEAALPGALHAAEHAAIGLLPLFAGCDRWDIGGLSTALHPDTGAPTVIVYDGFPGGAGFADRGHEILGPWLHAVRQQVAGCPCQGGCPSCVQSPKCGNGNHPLDKDGAVSVLDLVLDAIG